MKWFYLIFLSVFSLSGNEVIWSEGRFNDLDVVVDREKNLMWQDDKSVLNTRLNWKEAKDYCKNLKFAGFNDWYLPSKDELLSIVDKNQNPVINSSFKNCKKNGYWSSYFNSSNNALVIFFGSGYEYSDNKSNNNYIRCVRVGQYPFDTLFIKKEKELKNSKSDIEKINLISNYLIDIEFEKLKPIFPEKPQKPIIPPVEKLVKSEYETKKDFEQRIANEKIERAKLLKSLEKEYQTKVNEYNTEVKRLTKESNQKIEKLKANLQKVTLEAMKIAIDTVYRNPKVTELKYDAETERFFGVIKSERGDFKEKIAIKVPIDIAKDFKEDMENLKPIVTFDFTNNKLLLKDIKVINNSKTYTAMLTDTNYKPQKIEVVINDSNIDLSNAKLIENDFKVANSNYAISNIDYSIDPEIAKLQKRKLELEEETRKVKLAKEKQKELTKIKKQLEKDIDKLEDIEGGVDDLPEILANTKQVPINKNAYAIIIGVNRYDEAPNVPFADSSAKMFKEFIKKVIGVPEKNIVTMINEKATSGKIKSRIRRLLNLTNSNSTIYFYYAGHGVPSRKGKAYILPSDLLPSDIDIESKLMLDNIYKELAKSESKKVIAFIDSCFSGKDDNGKLLYEGVAPVFKVSSNKIIDESKMTIFTAGSSEEFANQYKDKSQRLFSYFVMRGLANGYFDTQKLHSYIYNNVLEVSKKIGFNYIQKIQLFGNKSGLVK